jgi:uncharacterized protein CbrC (UPF0167 family)
MADAVEMGYRSWRQEEFIEFFGFVEFVGFVGFVELIKIGDTETGRDR